MCIPATGQLIDPAPDQFLYLIPADPAKGLVNRQHFVSRVENHDAFTGRFKYRRRQAPLFHFTSQVHVELFTQDVGLLQVLNQPLVMPTTYLSTLIHFPAEHTHQRQKNTGAYADRTTQRAKTLNHRQNSYKWWMSQKVDRAYTSNASYQIEENSGAN